MKCMRATKIVRRYRFAFGKSNYDRAKGNEVTFSLEISHVQTICMEYTETVWSRHHCIIPFSQGISCSSCLQKTINVINESNCNNNDIIKCLWKLVTLNFYNTMQNNVFKYYYYNFKCNGNIDLFS